MATMQLPISASDALNTFDSPTAVPTPARRPGPNSSTPAASTWNKVERRRESRMLRTETPAFPLTPAGNRSLTYRIVKRTLDILGAATLIVLFSPLLIVTYAVLMITTRGKPIFAQERVGHCGRRFTMYKFRTMYLDADRRQADVRNEQSGPVFKNRRDPRITPLGRFLRSTSIDELPQLFNILLGDMALVGPRPPIMKEVAQYEAWQLRRLQVKPGLTCLWQVSGRCEISFRDWVRMDIWYVEHQNLWTDVGLLVKTPWSVLSRRGAY